MPPLFLFAPGAGAPSSHPWMQSWCKRLSVMGDVILFDYPYMLAGRRRPDPAAQLVAAHREATIRARESAAGPLILVGKSMGGRIGCHVANFEKVDALICFGYPLCGGGDPTQLRDRVLLELASPVLFVQGTRDGLCPLELLDSIRAAMKAPNEIYVVEGGDHSLAVGKRQLQSQGLTQDDVDEGIAVRINQFVGDL